mgnify:CR=1 FL=1
MSNLNLYNRQCFVEYFEYFDNNLIYCGDTISAINSVISGLKQFKRGDFYDCRI